MPRPSTRPPLATPSREPAPPSSPRRKAAPAPAPARAPEATSAPAAPAPPAPAPLPLSPAHEEMADATLSAIDYLSSALSELRSLELTLKSNANPATTIADALEAAAEIRDYLELQAFELRRVAEEMTCESQQTLTRQAVLLAGLLGMQERAKLARGEETFDLEAYQLRLSLARFHRSERAA